MEKKNKFISFITKYPVVLTLVLIVPMIINIGRYVFSDETVFYKPLTRENIDGIIELLIASLRERLEEKQLNLTVSDSAKKYIADEGYDPVYGARPLKRFLQSRVETLAAKLIIADDPEPGATLAIDFDGKELTGKFE